MHQNKIVVTLAGTTVGIKSFRGDGAYDKHKVRKLLTTKEIEQIIPPQHNAVMSKKARSELLARDQAIKRIKEIGRKQLKIRPPQWIYNLWRMERRNRVSPTKHWRGCYV